MPNALRRLLRAWAGKQIQRSIELIRYRRFEENLLMLELVHSPNVARQNLQSASTSKSNSVAARSTVDQYLSRRIAYRISQRTSELKDIFDAIRQFLSAFGDDVQVKELKFYLAYKRLQNFLCLEGLSASSCGWCLPKARPTVDLEDSFSRDVTNVGHFGTGNLQLSIKSMADFEKAQPLFRRAYEGG